MPISTVEIRRIGLILQYDGTSYCGWQRQSQGKSVQSVLEQVISELDPLSPVKAIAAGRTDSGVHAAGQVVHFDCFSPIPDTQWAKALNGRLPKTIRVLESVARPIEWHACHSAIYRRYRYSIYNGKLPNLFLAPWSWHRYQHRLNESLMQLALEGLLGSYDFSAFQKAGSERAHSWTTIQAVDLVRQGDLINLEIQASGFLYGMVRLLVGQLVAIGEERLPLDEFEKIWKGCLRSEVREAAPSHGLCLLRAGYKEKIFSEKTFSSMPKFCFDELNID